jgi:hypothetical protein
VATGQKAGLGDPNAIFILTELHFRKRNDHGAVTIARRANRVKKDVGCLKFSPRRIGRGMFGRGITPEVCPIALPIIPLPILPLWNYSPAIHSPDRMVPVSCSSCVSWLKTEWQADGGRRMNGPEDGDRLKPGLQTYAVPRLPW